jgi:hypothetical protein
MIAMNPFRSDADEFTLNVNLNTEMELPTSRDTVLHFFEQMKKRFPDLRNFYTREGGELVLEGDKEQDSYRCLAIEPRRLCSGHVDPATMEDAYAQHELVLELAPHLLTISVLDCEALDVMFGDDQISVYFTIRQYWGNGPEQSFLESFRHQRAIGEEIVSQHVIPRVIRPLAAAIAARG